MRIDNINKQSHYQRPLLKLGLFLFLMLGLLPLNAADDFNNICPLDLSNIAASYETCDGSNDAKITLFPDGGNAPYTYQWSNGGDTYEITGLSAGTYYVTVTDEDGCESQTSIEVELSPEGVWVMLSGTDASCVGGNNGTAYAGVMTGTPPFDIQWSNGQSGAEITGLSPGTYGVTVTDANGCFNDAETIIIKAGETTIDLSNIAASYETCEGSNDAKITLFPSGGDAPYTYNWSNGGDSYEITGLSAGTYYVTVTDENGCGAETSIEVELSPEGVWIMLSGTDATCNSNDGTAHVSVMTGTAPFDIQWSNGDSGEDIDGLAPDTYTVTVTDANGCTNSESITIGQEDSDLEISVSTSNATCNNNDGTATVTISGGDAPYTIEWSDGQSGTTATGLSAGSYDVTVTDDNNCSETIPFSIGQDSDLEISVSTTDASCNANDGTATVSITGGEAPYTIAWSDGQSGSTATGLSPDNYSVTVTDANGCTASTDFSIGQDDSDLGISVSTTDASCNVNDGTATVNITGGEAPYTIAWSTGESGTMISDLAPGNYSVTVTDANDCSETTPFSIGQDDDIEVSISTTDSACNADDGTATVTVTGGTPPYIIAWSTGDSGPSIENLAPGTYSVTVADDVGCSEIIDQVIIGEGPCPCEADAGTLTAVATPVCLTGAGVTISATPNGDAVIPFGYQVLYVLTSGTDLVIQSASPNPSFVVNAIGKYTIHTLVFDPTTLNLSGVQFGVTTAAQVNAILIQGGGDVCASLDVPGAMINVIDCCETPVLVSVVVIETPCGESKGSATIDVEGDESNYNYSWTPNVSDTYFANNIPSDTYTVVISDPNDPSCNIVETFTVGTIDGPDVTVETVPANCNAADGQATLSPDSLNYVWNDGFTGNFRDDLEAGMYQVEATAPSAPNCPSLITVVIGKTDTISGAYEIIALPDCDGANGAVQIIATPTGDYSYSWNDGGSGASRDDLTSGTYMVTISDNNPQGCEAIVEFTLPSGEEAICTVANDPILNCSGDANATVEYDIVYSPGFIGPPMITIFDSNNMPATNGQLSVGNYCIEIKDADGCIQGGCCFEVKSPDPINVDVAITDKDCTMGGTITLVEVIGGNGGYTYNWADIDGVDNPRNRTDLDAGSYSVTITDSKGCSVAINDLQVEEDCPCEAEAGTMSVVTESPVCFVNGMATLVASANGDAVIPDGFTQIFVLTSGPELVIINVNTTPEFVVNSLGTYTIHSFVYNPDSLNLLGVVQPGITTGFDVNELLIQGGGTVCGSLDVPGASFEVVECCENPIITDVVVIETHCDVDDGSAVINLAGDGPYIFTWNPNVSTTNAADSLAAGTYQVTIEDAADETCFVTEIFTVGTADGPDAGVVFQTAAACGLANATVVFAPDSLEYAWSDMGTGNSRSDLAAGTYQVTITDTLNSNCIDVQTVVVEETNDLTAAVTMVNGRPTCGQSDGSVTVGVTSSGSGDYSFDWGDGGSGATRDDLASGTHQVTVTDNMTMCLASLSFILLDSVVGDAMVMVDPGTTTNVSCIGDADGSVSYTITYSDNFALPADTIIVDAETGIQYTNGNLPAGDYCLEIKDALGCTAGGTCFKIGTPEQIDVDVAVISAGCDSIGIITIEEVLGGNGGFTFDWLDLENTINMKDRSGLAPGSYTVVVTDSKGCSVSATVDVPGVDPITIMLPDSIVICPGQEQAINPDGNDDYSYTWSPAAGLSDSTAVNPIASPMETTVYMVTAVNADGNCSTEGEVRVVVPPAIVVDITPRDSSWCEGPAVLTASSNTGVSYQWTDVDGAEISNTATAIVNPPTPTMYFVEVMDVYGCSAKDSTTAEVIIQELVFPPDTVTTCPGMPMALNMNGTDGLIYTWSPADDLNDPTATNPTSSANMSTTYTVVISDSTETCVYFDTLEYIVPMLLTLSVEGDSITCDAPMTTMFTASSNAADQYVWSTNPDFTDTIGTGPSYSATPGNPGETDEYYVMASNSAGCSISQRVSLTNQTIAGQLNPVDLVCLGDSTNVFLGFTQIPLGAELTYNWSSSSGSLEVIADGEVSIEPEDNATVNVSVSNQFGCMLEDSVMVEVNTFAEDIVAFPNRDSIFVGDTTALNVTMDDNFTYTWSNTNTLDRGDIPNPIASPPGVGFEDYIVTVRDEPSGCTATKDLRITIFDAECGPPNIFFPNAFSPNRDGMNDILYLRGFNLTDVQFVIYNRWGEKVFETRNQDEGWDGTFKGEDLCSDVYGYYLRAVCENGNVFTKQGNVTLFR